RHTRCLSDWSSDVCSSDLLRRHLQPRPRGRERDEHYRLHRRQVTCRRPEVDRNRACAPGGGAGGVRRMLSGGWWQEGPLPSVAEIGRASCREGWELLGWTG